MPLPEVEPCCFATNAHQLSSDQSTVGLHRCKVLSRSNFIDPPLARPTMAADHEYQGLFDRFNIVMQGPVPHSQVINMSILPKV